MCQFSIFSEYFVLKRLKIVKKGPFWNLFWCKNKVYYLDLFYPEMEMYQLLKGWVNFKQKCLCSKCALKQYKKWKIVQKWLVLKKHLYIFAKNAKNCHFGYLGGNF